MRLSSSFSIWAIACSGSANANRRFFRIGQQADVQRAAVGVRKGAHIGDNGIALPAAHGQPFVEILNDVGAFFLRRADEIEGRLRRHVVRAGAGKVVAQEELAQRFES